MVDMEDRLEGAVLGALFATPLIAITPGIPDEVIGIPLGAIFGSLIGRKALKSMI